ncbi:vancomycin high temperature exclusion protein [uncultured Haemophilus sp.]|uniref:SanA/YdcF family protein n=1 Tax=uncultured Haemophilus sp. TaxID=237779 RepID=UPI0035A68AC8
MQLLSQMLSKMTALLASLRLPLKKLLSYVLGFSLVALISCFIIDRAVSFYVQDRVYEDIKTLPHRHYALVLGTSKYIAKGKTNKYYDYRLEASKSLIDQNKVDYLLLSGDNRTIQYNEPRTMFQDLRKMGVSESVMFKDFAGFRTLDSVVRANKVFQVPSFTIISQKFHCERALLIAKHYDIDAICFTAKQPEVYFGTRVREMFARVKAVLDLIIGVKPYFLGTPEPLPMPAE